MTNVFLLSCYNEKEFYSYNISKNDEINIDYNLSDGVNGLDVAKRLYNLGYKNINLVTGEVNRDELKQEYIKEIRGKRPNFNT
jgi:hypothetical protein